MKTKLLTICLLLFTTQVFATEIGIKCKNLNTKSYNLWKYIETPTKKKIQIKETLNGLTGKVDLGLFQSWNQKQK